MLSIVVQLAPCSGARSAAVALPTPPIGGASQACVYERHQREGRQLGVKMAIRWEQSLRLQKVGW